MADMRRSDNNQTNQQENEYDRLVKKVAERVWQLWKEQLRNDVERTGKTGRRK